MGVAVDEIDEKERKLTIEKMFSINEGLLLRERLPKWMWRLPFQTFVEEKNLLLTLKPWLVKIVQRRIDAFSLDPNGCEKYDVFLSS